MALVSIAFIGAFWFALSRPTPSLSSPPTTTAYAADHPTIEDTAITSGPPRQAEATDEADFICDEAQATDGDTLRCGALRVRLASIDAPEMPGHCRRGRKCVDGDPYASKAHLERLVARSPVTCRQTDTDRYGRIVALCETSGRDLSCSQVQAGHAVIRYGDLHCPVG